jgi:LysM repeat protein
MARRGLLTFVVFNVIVSAVVAFAVITLVDDGEGEVTERQVTFVVVHTATQNPNPPTPIIITATPLPGELGRVGLPTEVLDGTVVVPTVARDEAGNIVAEVQALPENCIQHVIDEGDFPSVLAQEYDVDFFELMAVNNLTEETATQLQIGDVLIIPLEGCPLEAFTQPTAEPTEEATAEATAEANAEATEDVGTPTITLTPTETIIPTVTLAPTAANAQVEIVEVIGAGDITSEGVVVRNNGNTIDISGWTLSDGDGNVFVFPEGRRLFSGAGVTIYSRQGEETPILFFWGRDTAVFGEPGDVVVLANRDGDAQATLRLPDVP